MSLENIVKQETNKMGRISKENYSRVMVTSDYHIPFHDEESINVMLDYANDYKPDKFYINGDFLDFYSISTFDKNPERKENLQTEIYKGREVLANIRDSVKKSTEIIFLKGNHEDRLQRFLYKNPGLYGLDVLSMDSLLDFKKYGVKLIGSDIDYWAKHKGTTDEGDMVIGHGGTTQGFKYSQYSGYGEKNTVQKIHSNVCMGHSHRLAKHYQTDYQGNVLVGLNSGCLCMNPGYAWQKGFVTFEKIGDKTTNHKVINIESGKLFQNGKIYSR